MQITIRYFTVLREITGKQAEPLQFPENEKITINLVIKTLRNRYGKPFSEYIFEPNTWKVKGFLQFFVNGQSVAGLKGIETELREGDVVAIVPPVGGG